MREFEPMRCDNFKERRKPWRRRTLCVVISAAWKPVLRDAKNRRNVPRLSRFGLINGRARILHIGRQSRDRQTQEIKERSEIRNAAPVPAITWEILSRLHRR